MEYLWQVRPDLTRTDPLALSKSGCYRRSRLTTSEPGAGELVEGPDSAKVTTAADFAQVLAPLLDGAIAARFLVGLRAGYGIGWKALAHEVRSTAKFHPKWPMDRPKIFEQGEGLSLVPMPISPGAPATWRRASASTPGRQAHPIPSVGVHPCHPNPRLPIAP
ncbi:hypothetical protein GCM10023088_68540 [Actinomadura verrucosospora]|uniref:hypothetical protein n=1 Tax=Actinomadura verrucosospora TaxID=46165 RepID=UPI0031E77907